MAVCFHYLPSIYYIVLRIRYCHYETSLKYVYFHTMVSCVGFVCVTAGHVRAKRSLSLSLSTVWSHPRILCVIPGNLKFWIHCLTVLTIGYLKQKIQGVIRFEFCVYSFPCYLNVGKTSV